MMDGHYSVAVNVLQPDVVIIYLQRLVRWF